MKKSFTLIRPIILSLILMLGIGSNAWGATYKVITSEADLTDGYYVIASVDATKGKTLAMTSTNAGKFFTHVEVTPTNDILTDPADNIIWKITSDGTNKIIFSENSSKYVSYKGSSNEAYQEDAVTSDNQRWSFSYDGSKSVFIVKNAAIAERVLQYNPSAPRFACYKASQTNLVLYKLEATADPVINAPKTTDLGNVDINEVGTKTITVTTANLTGTNITATITAGDNDFSVSPATLPIEGGELTIEVFSDIEGACSGTLTLTDGTTTATVSLTANIVDPSKFIVATIAELKAKGTEDQTSVYTLTGDLTAIFQKGTSLYVQDATGALLIYGNAITKEYAEGAVITGGLKGTLTEYNGLFQLIPTEDMAEGTGSASITPTEATIAQLKATPKNYESQLVKIKDVTFAAAAFTSNNVNISVEEDIMVCRNGFYTVTGPLPSTAHITGLITIYKTDVQIFPRNNDDIQSTVSLSDLTTTTNIFASNGVLNIKLTSAQTITIYNIQGQALIQTTGKEGWNQINLSNKGIVVVKVDNNMTKVML